MVEDPGEPRYPKTTFCVTLLVVVLIGLAFGLTVWASVKTAKDGEGTEVNGNWGAWGRWTTCSSRCGSGHRNRARKCDNPAPAFGGEPCQGSSMEVETCELRPCNETKGGAIENYAAWETLPEGPGEWAPWSAWGSCSKTCLNGTMTRSRVCVGAPGVRPVCVNGSSTATSLCMLRDSCVIPINGQWNYWWGWSDCSEPCGGGTRQRTRDCDRPAPKDGGSDCYGEATQTGECNAMACPAPIDGVWANWGEWSGCNETCGGGSNTRARTCTNPAPLYGGADCSGSATETVDCNPDPCPVDGAWSSWGAWGDCNETCAGGVRLRERTCTDPAPLHGGSNCTGSPSEEEACNTTPCPIDGAWSAWGAWADCSVTCGGGSAVRERECSDPAPAYGGTECVGAANETMTCNESACP